MTAAIILVLAVAVLAILMRVMGGRDAKPASGTGPDRPEPRETERDHDAHAGAAFDDDDDDMNGDVEDGELVEAAAITSDGWSFIPRGGGVELVPPGEDDELLNEQSDRHGSEQIRQAMASAPLNPRTGRRIVFWRPGEQLSTGDMIAARVVRGAPGVDPWRLEALGRDYDYRPYAFETEDGARTALELVETRIVRPPKGEHGEPIPVGAEDFAVARRKYEETEQALAMDPDTDPPA